MTLWHKPTERPRRKKDLVIAIDKYEIYKIEPFIYLNYDIDLSEKWCYLSDLLKLEKDNKALQKKLDIAVKALEQIVSNAPSCFKTDECPLGNGAGYDDGCSRCPFADADDTLDEIKGNK